jgi:pilus assembly protein Flp/PilA
MDLFILKTWLEAKFTPKHDETGASLVEYGLLVALIAVVAIVAVQLLGRKVSSNFTNVSGAI